MVLMGEMGGLLGTGVFPLSKGCGRHSHLLPQLQLVGGEPGNELVNPLR